MKTVIREATASSVCNERERLQLCDPPPTLYKVYKTEKNAAK